MKLKNPLLKDIKARFPMAYAIALHSSSILTERYGHELKDDEVGYLALAFALAIERQNTELPKKNILIVCASGKGSRPTATLPLPPGIWLLCGPH